MHDWSEEFATIDSELQKIKEHEQKTIDDLITDEILHYINEDDEWAEAERFVNEDRHDKDW